MCCDFRRGDDDAISQKDRFTSEHKDLTRNEPMQFAHHHG